MSDDIAKRLIEMARDIRESWDDLAPSFKYPQYYDRDMEKADLLEAAGREIERLRVERDEARREVCGMNESGLRMNDSDKQREAKRRGWDCFKEAGCGKTHE